MVERTSTHELEEFATGYQGLRVHRAVVALDERQDGEPVTRVALLLDDPEGDTWAVDLIRELRHALGHRATELRLPPVSLTLVPESEAELLDSIGS